MHIMISLKDNLSYRLIDATPAVVILKYPELSSNAFKWLRTGRILGTLTSPAPFHSSFIHDSITYATRILQHLQTSLSVRSRIQLCLRDEEIYDTYHRYDQNFVSGKASLTPLEHRQRHHYSKHLPLPRRIRSFSQIAQKLQNSVGVFSSSFSGLDSSGTGLISFW